MLLQIIRPAVARVRVGEKEVSRERYRDVYNANVRDDDDDECTPVVFATEVISMRLPYLRK